MDQPLISVIVPVYKAEQSLRKCVDSIRNQSYTNLEIILVDDGSPDHCGEICDTVAREDSRVRVFHKENGGQSSARNLGLDRMTGAYVTFVDSDDWIEPEYYKTILALMLQKNAEIGVCGLQCDFADGRKAWFNRQYPQNQAIEIMSTEDALRENTYASKITNSPCDKLFARKIFDGIRMRERAAYEDYEIMAQCLSRADCIVYNPYPFYHYAMTEESVTRGELQEKHFLEAQIAKERVSFFEQTYPKLKVYAIANQVEIGLMLYYRAEGHPQYSNQRKEIKTELRKRAEGKLFGVLRTTTKVKYILFLLWPWLYVRFMDLLKK